MSNVASQGYRIDLNLKETPSDADAWGNLYKADVAEDLKVWVNNKRNLSILKFNHEDTATGIGSIHNGFFEFGIDNEFVYTTDDVVGFSHDVRFPTSDGSGNISIPTSSTFFVMQSDSYTKFKISATSSVDEDTVQTAIPINGNPNQIAGRAWSGHGSLISFTHDGKKDLSRPASTSGLSATGGNGTGALFDLTDNGLTITIANSGTDPSGKAIGQGYKKGNTLTLASADIGGGDDIILTVTSVQDLEVQRKDPVEQDHMLNFQKPLIQDNEDFNYLGGNTLLNAFEQTQTDIENSKYFVNKKYKGTANTETDRDVKFEGSVSIGDTTGYNQTGTAIDSKEADGITPKSPGVFIGNTRAFSTDNNPWTETGDALTTESEEVTIGDLHFKDNVNISGIGTEHSDPEAIADWTHKMPVVINGETYYLLLTR